MDYSYKCNISPYGYAAKHSNEEIFDIEPGGDDGGALGGCTNTALLLSSLGLQVSLMTTVGEDQEGERALALMKGQNLQGIFLQLPSVQTITRMRFFIHNPSTGAYDLRYRMNKEPNLFLAAQEGRSKLREKGFVDSFLH
jgi:bifunctional ADP-heptose synthase (sugar kinase/adenylyltransferase)